jgi:hypothetical protein
MKEAYLKIGCKLLYDGLPSHEAFYENICGFEILKLDIFLDEGLIPGHGRPISAATTGPRISTGKVGLLWPG